MKKYSLIALTIFAQQSMATDPLGELIGRLETIDTIKCEEMTHEQLAENCMREVCGPPGNKISNLTANNIDKFLTPKQKEELKTIESNVSAIYKKKEKQLKDMISELEKRKSDPKFTNTDQWEDYHYSNFSNLFWKFFQWEVDSSKPINERGVITIDDTAPANFLPAIKEVSEEFRKSVYNDPLYAYDVGIFNEDELKSAILEKAQKLKKDLSSFDVTKFGQELSQLSDKDEIATHLAKIEDLASENGIVITSKDYYCKDNCKKTINQYLKNFNIDETIENLKASLAYLDEKDKIAQCKANYITVNQQNNLSNNFDKIWPEVKSSYEKNVLPRFSEHSRRMMQDYLDNGLHFYFENPTYEELPDLNKVMEETNKEDSQSQKRNADLLSDLVGNYYDQDINIISADIQICKNTYPSLIWDSYMAKENILPMFAAPYYAPQKDNIAVSPYSCEHHREGAGIVAHELGHAMSQLMGRDGMSSSSLKDYRTIRSCASSQWDINAPAERIHHPQDKQFTEEDTADIFSYMAVNDGQSLYACGFLDTDREGKNYTDFSTDPWGSHSPSLIRLLREMSYKKASLPQTCTHLMAKHQDKLGDKKCF